MKNNETNILVYRLGSLGDTVMVLPCLHEIRKHYPSAKITLLTNKPVMTKAAAMEAVLGTEGYFFNDTISYPVGTRNPLTLLKLVWAIRSLKISTVINLVASRSTSFINRDYLFFKTAGISNLIGFDRAEKDVILTIDENTGRYEWEAKRLARRVSALGDIPLNADEYWDLRLSEQELNSASDLLEQADTTAPIIAISTGTKLQANDWEIDNWVNLLKQLSLQLPGWQLIVLGAKEESVSAGVCLAAWNGAGKNLCGQTSPRVSAAVLKSAKVFIGHDSGPMHLAACVGVPCVGIFSARNLPGQWFPRGDNNTIIYHQPNCAGCGLEICITEKKKCILSITVAEVQDAVMKIVSEVPQTAIS